MIDSLELIKISSIVKNTTFYEQFAKTEKKVNNINDLAHVQYYYKDDNSWYLIGSKTCCYDGLSYLTKAIELNKTNADYYYARGLNREQEQSYLVKLDFDEAVKLNPKYEWYDAEKSWMYKCADCNGKGHKLVVNVKKQEVNGVIKSNSSSEQVKCQYCENGYFKKIVKVKSIRLKK